MWWLWMPVSVSRNKCMMKKQDVIFILGVAVVLLPFFISEPVFRFYHTFNAEHGMVMSFIKFAILSTLGSTAW